MSIMSNTPLPADLRPSSAIPDRGETGGGRPPARSTSHQIRPVTVPTPKIEIRVDPIEMILFSMVRWSGEPWN